MKIVITHETDVKEFLTAYNVPMDFVVGLKMMLTSIENDHTIDMFTSELFKEEEDD